MRSLAIIAAAAAVVRARRAVATAEAAGTGRHLPHGYPRIGLVLCPGKGAQDAIAKPRTAIAHGAICRAARFCLRRRERAGRRL